MDSKAYEKHCKSFHKQRAEEYLSLWNDLLRGRAHLSEKERGMVCEALQYYLKEKCR